MMSEISGQKMPPCKYSVVVPIYNEAECVGELHRQLVSVFDSLKKAYELIFVNDGSRDATLKIMRSLKPLTIVNFSRNFGQTASLDAGIKQSRGEIIITLDGDLQNPPSEIPKLLDKLENSRADAVAGWRRHRHDPFLKKLNSRMANRLRWMFIRDNVHDSGCTLKAFRREALEHLELYGELHRFIPALLTINGYRVAEVEVRHEERKKGKTKYNWKRGFKGILDMLAVWFWHKYSARPLHLFGGLGIISMLAGFVCGGFALYLKIFEGKDLSDTALTLFAGLLCLFGVLFIVSGLLADMIVRNRYAILGHPPYRIREVIRNENS